MKTSETENGKRREIEEEKEREPEKKKRERERERERETEINPTHLNGQVAVNVVLASHRHQEVAKVGDGYGVGEHDVDGQLH